MPYIMMVEGRHLDIPELVSGKRSKMKIFNIDPLEDLPVDTIDYILQIALDLYRSGALKSKSR